MLKVAQAILILCCSLVSGVSFAQGYAINWYKVASGGGASTSGGYSISGTVGQHDASLALSGGGYSLTGGFWAAVQTIGAPRLNIMKSGTGVTIYWSSTSAGFMLQQNPNLRSTSWIFSPYAVTTNGTTESVIVNSPTGNMYFRLSTSALI